MSKYLTSSARKQSGTYAIGSIPPAPALPSDLVAEELRARLATMPTTELLGLLSMPAPAAPSLPAPTSPTVRTLIKRVLGRGAMRSQDIVVAVQTLRPGTPGPTVRSDLSRMRAEGELKAVGPVRGGKLRQA